MHANEDEIGDAKRYGSPLGNLLAVVRCIDSPGRYGDPLPHHLREDGRLVIFVGLLIRPGHHADAHEPPRLSRCPGDLEGRLARHLPLTDQRPLEFDNARPALGLDPPDTHGPDVALAHVQKALGRQSRCGGLDDAGLLQPFDESRVFLKLDSAGRGDHDIADHLNRTMLQCRNEAGEDTGHDDEQGDGQRHGRDAQKDDPPSTQVLEPEEQLQHSRISTYCACKTWQIRVAASRPQALAMVPISAFKTIAKLRLTLPPGQIASIPG